LLNLNQTKYSATTTPKKHPQRCTTDGNASSTIAAATAVANTVADAAAAVSVSTITADASVILPPLSNAAYDCSAAEITPTTVLRSTATAAETITVAYNPAAFKTAFSSPTNNH
jgi:hypothetical protein